MVIGGIGYDTIHANRIINEELYNYIVEHIYSYNLDVTKDKKIRSNGKTLLRVKYKGYTIHVYLKKNLQISVHLSVPKIIHDGCNVTLSNHKDVTKAINIIDEVLGLGNLDGYGFRTFHLSRIDIATNLMLDTNPLDMVSIPAPNYFKIAAAYNETVYFVATNKKVRFHDLSQTKNKKEENGKLKEALADYKRHLVIYEKKVEGYNEKALRFEARLKTRKIIRDQFKYKPTVEALEKEEFHTRCVSHIDKLMSSIIRKKNQLSASTIGRAYLSGETQNHNKGLTIS